MQALNLVYELEKAKTKIRELKTELQHYQTRELISDYAKQDNERLLQELEVIKQENEKLAKDNIDFKAEIEQLRTEVTQMKHVLNLFAGAFDAIVLEQLAFSLDSQLNKVTGCKRTTPLKSLIETNKVPKDFESKIPGGYTLTDLNDAMEALKLNRKQFAHICVSRQPYNEHISEAKFRDLVHKYVSTYSLVEDKDFHELTISFVIEYLKKANGVFRLVNTH